MKQRKLNYTFYNPNTTEATLNYILKLLIEVNAPKAKKAIIEAANQQIYEGQTCDKQLV